MIFSWLSTRPGPSSWLRSRSPMSIRLRDIVIGDRSPRLAYSLIAKPSCCATRKNACTHLAGIVGRKRKNGSRPASIDLMTASWSSLRFGVSVAFLIVFVERIVDLLGCQCDPFKLHHRARPALGIAPDVYSRCGHVVAVLEQLDRVRVEVGAPRDFNSVGVEDCHAVYVRHLPSIRSQISYTRTLALFLDMCQG